jgi:hypothetical protein
MQQRNSVHSNKRKIQSKHAGDDAKVKVLINVRGKRAAGDVDGKISTVLDCMVAAGLIVDDRVTIINRGTQGFERAKVSGVDIILLEEE